MRRNCNLELRLLPPSASFLSADSSELPQHHHRNYSINMMEESSESPPSHSQQQQQQQQHQHQPLTIFYNGNICVCDVTELQARTILFYASKEVEERLKTPTGNDPCSPNVQSQMSSPTAGLSMKRSLQRFLQKRRHRVQATSPYNHH
ncbi:protein TIFY 5A [Ziziphus jujuba]|uniref:Protein TIFY n=2 Tax=Ziziphus jujuba TaxID=326968 RepID=A0A6P3ZBH5_ZIZJJ|nr:protein TIFY 5A [Ziziphus jujuba]KAH7545162.1 hypothetical protein FEM48_Zijuj01G0064400 [Ziziphus jujuba var. spinosa]